MLKAFLDENKIFNVKANALAGRNSLKKKADCGKATKVYIIS